MAENRAANIASHIIVYWWNSSAFQALKYDKKATNAYKNTQH